MITGDHLETAKQVAIKAGIVTEAESNTPGVCITGDEFVDQLQGYEKIWDPNSSEWNIKFHNPSAFTDLKKRVRVVARCTTENKFVLVSGIK